MMQTRWFRVGMVLGVLVAGCSKNESASTACASMTDTKSCSDCCAKNGASGHKIATGSPCQCMGGDTKAAAPAAAADFAGTYKSSWGPTVFTQTGNQISATYPTGTMRCVANGSVADCDWKEAKGTGKARLVKDANGTVNGTWGMGASATDGGAWNFTP